MSLCVQTVPPSSRPFRAKPLVLSSGHHKCPLPSIPGSFPFKLGGLQSGNPPFAIPSPLASKLLGQERRPLFHSVFTEEPDAIPDASQEDDPTPSLRQALQLVEAKIAELTKERVRLASLLDSAVSSRSPVHRLPRELLAAIFAAGVCEDDGTREDPLLLGSVMLVCSHWRDVAVDTPTLWSRVVVDEHNSVEAARRRILRSKDAPLDIRLHLVGYAGHDRPPAETISRAMDVLRPTVGRWRTFSLRVPTPSDVQAVLRDCQRPAPLLEEFSVHVAESLQEDLPPPPSPLFAGHTPRLVLCNFASFDFGWNRHHSVRDLRVLKLDGYWGSLAPSTDELLALLRACPALEEFSLRNCYDVDVEMDPCGLNYPEAIVSIPLVATALVIRLPRLRSLSLCACGNARVRALLAHLVFPALEDLELSCVDDVTAVLGHLASHRRSLRRLRIDSCSFSETQLVRLLHFVPDLVTLEVVDSDDVSAELLRILCAPAPAQPWLCPSLEALSLEGCASVAWSDLRNLVEARLPSHSRSYRTWSPAPGVSWTTDHPIQRPPAKAVSLHARAMSSPPADCVDVFGWPCRLRSLDVTRCHRLSSDMVRWLRRTGCAVKHDKETLL